VRLPTAGGSGAEHLYVALATAGTETTNGVQTPYQIRGGVPATAAVGALPAPVVGGFNARPSTNAALAFHAMLRAREQGIVQTPFPGGASLNAGSVAMLPPIVGDKRTFKVCSTPTCGGSVPVAATAQSVGQKVAIFVDDSNAGAYGPATLDSLKLLFDNELYRIDTTAFGRESDVDNNGVVIVLLTQQINKLSPTCNATGSVILGYFFGPDLIPGAGWNDGEVFYGLVPVNLPPPANCNINKSYAETLIAPTFIHEFQHMISFNQHQLKRNGGAEDTWLNEGLSHFAEELGGRQISNPAFCARSKSGTPDCFSQFASGDAENGYKYLEDPESFFLIEPGSSQGSLEERGANWLMVRWLADHFGTLQADKSNPQFTRALVETNLRGAANVAAVTGESFSTLVTQWQLANYLDDLPGFTPSTNRMQYLSWNFRTTFASFNTQFPNDFTRPYPLVPDSTSAQAYTKTGTLKAGSGRHVRVVQAAGGTSVDLLLTGQNGAAVSASVAPRIGLARIR
jgi:hypothetical protein